MSKLFDVEVRGETRAVEKLRGVSKDADFAVQTAFRAWGRSARSKAAKKFASRWGLPQKIFRNRVQYFGVRHKGKHREYARLWAGIGALPRWGEHPAVNRRLRALKLEELPINLGAVGYLKESAEEAVLERYIPVLRQDYERRVAKRSRARSRRR